MAITRRQFLRRSAITAVGLSFSSPLLEGVALGASQRARSAPGGVASNKVLVTLNLYGGNDGLNTVVPLSQYDLYRSLRPTLAIPPERAVRLPDTADLALNPGMTAMRDLYAQGKLAILLGVGTPQDSAGLFDHEVAQNVFQSADIRQADSASAPTGWVGRYLDTVEEGIVTPGVDFGGGGRLLLSGMAREGLTINSIAEFRIQPSFDTEARMAAYDRIMNIPSSDPVAERNRLIRKDVLAKSAIVQERTQNYVPAVEYPDVEFNYLSYSLLQCAQLISADIGVRAISVYYDGFDTHAGQNDGGGGAELGYHDTLWKDISDALGAFQADLQGHGLADRVLVMTLSEFGRRPEENNDRGTDHGFGSVAFVLGNAVRGGVYGQHPSLAPEHLVLDGNLDVTTDFRSIYATVLDRFLDADPAPVLGGQFPVLGFL